MSAPRDYRETKAGAAERGHGQWRTPSSDWGPPWMQARPAGSAMLRRRTGKVAATREPAPLWKFTVSFGDMRETMNKPRPVSLVASGGRFGGIEKPAPPSWTMRTGRSAVQSISTQMGPEVCRAAFETSSLRMIDGVI